MPSVCWLLMILLLIGLQMPCCQALQMNQDTTNELLAKLGSQIDNSQNQSIELTVEEVKAIYDLLNKIKSSEQNRTY